MKDVFLFIILLFVLHSCKDPDTEDNSAVVKIQEIESPVKSGGMPNLFVSDENEVFLSWIEFKNDSTDILMFSKLENGNWSSPLEIAAGNNWFVNWADFPSVVRSKSAEGFLAAHWLQKSAEGTFDYDIRISVSKDEGKNWSPSFIPHTDGIYAEHGFVSLLPLENGRILAIWLDGRNTKTEEHHNSEHMHAGAMTLRAVEFNEKGELFNEVELDNRVCDCCQTDAILNTSVPVVIYRDRSEDEIRDIYLTRNKKGSWSDPVAIHHDGWEISGCPVNGPALDALGGQLAIAWFTGAKDTSKVNVVFSSDAGESFASLVQVDNGNPLGRVDVVLAEPNVAFVSWIEETDNEAKIMIAEVFSDGRVGLKQEISKTKNSRQSGFPIMEKLGDQLLLAWTSVDSISTVKTAFVSIKEH